MSRLILVRHGQIEANIKQIWHGTTDSPLTAEGREQARKTGEHIQREHPHITNIYTSPLQRTRHTAEAIGHALGLEVKPEPNLIEYGIGELEGTHYRDLFEEHKFFQTIINDPHYAPIDGESLHSVFTRMQIALFRIAEQHQGETTVVVSHGMAMGIVMSHFFTDKLTNWEPYMVKNCAISELCLAAEPKLLRLNEVAHLD